MRTDPVNEIEITDNQIYVNICSLNFFILLKIVLPQYSILSINMYVRFILGCQVYSVQTSSNNKSNFVCPLVPSSTETFSKRESLKFDLLILIICNIYLFITKFVYICFRDNC